MLQRNAPRVGRRREAVVEAKRAGKQAFAVGGRRELGHEPQGSLGCTVDEGGRVELARFEVQAAQGIRREAHGRSLESRVQAVGARFGAQLRL